MEKDKKGMLENRVRVNITMSKEMIDFYQGLSESMGIPRSAVMVMAMKNYMDNQEVMKTTSQMMRDLDKNKLS